MAPTFWEMLLPLTSRLYGRVIDLGCNVGTYVRALDSIPSITEACGLDIDPEYLKAWVSDPRHRYFVADIINTGFEENAFDCAICWETMEHLPEPLLGLAEIRRIVKDMILFTVPTPAFGNPDDSHLPFHRRHNSLWSIDEFRELLTGNGFEIVDHMIGLDGTNQAWLCSIKEGENA